MADEDDKEMFDELEYDDDDSESDFTIRDRLPAPVALQYTTEELHRLIHEGVIDLSPPYQREVVWPEVKQSRLIDSIYRNYYVPPVVFAQVIDDGAPVLRCVDGKQRLTSIQRFFDGHIPYRDPKTGKAYWYAMPEQAKSKLEVPNKWKNDFSAKRITCIKYEGLPSGLERDIFQRVQLGMPLSAAEKLQAIASPWSEWISDLSRRMLTSETGLQDKIDVDLGRGRDFQILASLVYCCDGIPSRTVASSTKLEQFLLRTDRPRSEFMQHMSDVLKTLWVIAEDNDLNMAFTSIKQRVAPVEFVFIGVLLYVLRECTRKQRAHALMDLRISVRDAFQGNVRLREDVQRFLWDFVNEQALKLNTGVYLDPGAPPKKRNRTKRARENGTDEEEYSPRKSKGRKKKSQ
ncbi:hypothetical protein NM688_g6746 [Phlebia brevispora]|uniref:Uncharacterized protein n=1 Tax=Phlebia brevispora TaxID=194682 RepID=A0ACC1SD53_9APHY|nr:hypothetical protein NM688_g6746 [Phlebia brevispora]